jgi:hypothetical protein
MGKMAVGKGWSVLKVKVKRGGVVIPFMGSSELAMDLTARL